MRQFLALLLTILFLLSSSGCGAGQVLGPTLTPTLTSTETPTLTPTATVTPSPTPIPTPSVEVGLRPENAATQTYENGIWVVKNADGKTTATWNEQTSEWTYNTENIITKQIILGYDVDPAVIEPFLGPLPPDDPSTHFIDPDTGKRVGYGIGPEMLQDMFGSPVGTYTASKTLVFARFRGVVTAPLPPEWTKTQVAMIVDVPQTADTSIILISRVPSESFLVSGAPNDSIYVDIMKVIYHKEWGGPSGMSLANEYLIGKMVAVAISHDSAPFFINNDAYETILAKDYSNKAILDYIAGKSTQIPNRAELQYSIIFPTPIFLPESQYPTD